MFTLNEELLANVVVLNFASEEAADWLAIMLLERFISFLI
jgi:hypothetical protein